MKPIFTIHAGEYLVAEHIERTHPAWNIWVPSKDTGIDLLITEATKQRMVSLQIKFSKDFLPGHDILQQNRLLAAGWWTHDVAKMEKSKADFWILVLPSFVEKQTSFIILRPAELLRRLKAIHGATRTRTHSYLQVTKTKRCWETRGLAWADEELVALDRFSNTERDFTAYLNSWKKIEEKLK